MKLKEILKREKEIMSPFRRTLVYKIIPLWLAVCVLPLAAVIPLMIIDEEKYLPVFIAWMVWWIVWVIALLVSLPFITKKETQIELERYGYLFKKTEPLENDQITVDDEGVIYTLDKHGVRAKFPIEADQVFDEANEDSFFVAWERAELAFASQSYLRRIHIALAVFSTDMDAPPFFIPITKEVLSAIKAFDLEKQLGGEWTYLFYNPEDAFKQILTKGRILKMRNKKTGKVFVDAQGNFIGDEE